MVRHIIQKESEQRTSKAQGRQNNRHTHKNTNTKQRRTNKGQNKQTSQAGFGFRFSILRFLGGFIGPFLFFFCVRFFRAKEPRSGARCCEGAFRSRARRLGCLLFCACRLLFVRGTHHKIRCPTFSCARQIMILSLCQCVSGSVKPTGEGCCVAGFFRMLGNDAASAIFCITSTNIIILSICTRP